MKCKFLDDMHVDHKTFPEDQATPDKIIFKDRRVHGTNKIVKDMYLKAGAEYEHPQAAFFVQIGAAVPADDECKAACADISEEQLEKAQLDYKANDLGITDPEDRELFFKRVIAGYEHLGEGELAYIKGPMWDAYFGAEKSAVKKDLGI